MPTGVSNTSPASAVDSVMSGAPLKEIVDVFEDPTSTTSNSLLAFFTTILVPDAMPDKSSPVPATILLFPAAKVTFAYVAALFWNTSSPSVNEPLIPFASGVKNS